MVGFALSGRSVSYKMDGYEVCRELKTNPVTAYIPVIFVSTKGEIADREKGFGFGAVDYVTNPHALRAQQSMKHLQNWTNGHNYHLF